MLYPGLGLGAIVSRASRISDGMFAAAASAVSSLVTVRQPGASLLPHIDDLRSVSVTVAVAVAEAADAEGLAGVKFDDIVQQVQDAMWQPEYRRISGILRRQRMDRTLRMENSFERNSPESARSPLSAITCRASAASPRSRPTCWPPSRARIPKASASPCRSMTFQGGYEYPEVVRFEIEEQDLSSYLRAADFLNISNVDIVCLQHEFGIFGGPAGSHILALLRELRMPVVTTLHTVLREPNADQRRVMQELIALSTRLVVMAERGRQMLQEIYQAPPAKIDLIPHGIPDIAFVDPNYFKDQFGVEGKVVLLTFGLLSPNKGIEYVLNALPEILAEFPDVVYIVLGATHPNELREHGEAYRLSLERLAKKNKVEKNVIFYNRFVELENLKEFIGAADLYITPYLNEAQITSGTLAYAFGAGKAVVSTPYWHAAELLAEDRGVLVPFGDAPAIAREVIGLLRDDTRRHAMRKNAYKLGREMIWSNVAQLYMRSFELARLEGAARSRKFLATKTLDQKPRELPELKLSHLSRMTDSTGVFQHAIFSVPNFAEGYCTDDNARAFILAVLLGELGEEPERVRTLATTYAAFLHHAFDPKTKRFRNHLSFDRRWLDEQGSEDCHGRALWALGVGVGRSPFRSFQMMAGQLFAQALPAVTEFTSPRAWAFGLIGIHEYLRRLSGDRLVNQTRETLTCRLMELFEAQRAAGLAVV